MKVAPSILSADFGNMANAVRNLELCGADFVHCDVMDGVYVPNITFGMPMVKSLRKDSNLPFDVHLMIVSPEKYVDKFFCAGADIVTIHPEVCADVQGCIDCARKHGKMIGLAVNADVSFDVVLPYLNQIDLVLIMTVQAGFGGQSFKEDCLDKVRLARELRQANGYHYEIEVDGGVNATTVGLCKDAGVDIVVAGSAVFGADDMQSAIVNLQKA